ncbi:MAG: outer membrane protein [Micavibrio sp.]|nr:outer membrane protein [Micavibrio sp.]
MALLFAAGVLLITPADAATNKISANFGQGAIILGPNSNTCNLGLQGAIRFTSGSPGQLAFCDSLTAGWVTLGGGSTPAGADTQIQFNSGGTSLGATSSFTYSVANNILALANTGTGALRPGVGLLSAPSHSFTAGTGTGMFTVSPEWQLNFAVGGVEALRLYNTPSAVNHMTLTPGITGNAPTITNLGTATSGTGLGLTFSGKASSGADQGNGSLFLKGGNGNGSGAGGGLTFNAGTPGATGSGSQIYITGGTGGGAGQGNGGSVSIAAGGATSGTAGSILFQVGGTTYLTIQPPGTANASIVFGGSTAITVPPGTTAQRPTTSLINGMLRYNTTTFKFEAVQAGGWANVTSSAATLDDLSDAITNYTVTPTAAAPSIYSMFIGSGSGVNAATGAAYNTALGQNALGALTTGGENTALGYSALASVTTGSRNTAGGSRALMSNTADDNTALGYRALTNNTTGTRNTAVGGNALAANLTGNDLTAVGYNALASNTTGSMNSALGTYALASMVSGSYNSAAGYMAMASATGSHNSFVGWKAGQGVGGDNNTGVGALVFGSANFTGSRNSGLGYGAGSNVTSGNDNTFIGYMAGSTTTTGSNNIMIGANAVASSPTASNELNIANTIYGTVGGTNYVLLDSKQHMVYKGSTPSISACGTATIAGNDNVFVVTRTATSVSSCTITFANSWTNIPHCIARLNVSSVGYISAASTSAITVTHPSSSLLRIFVMCRGYL